MILAPAHSEVGVPTLSGSKHVLDLHIENLYTVLICFRFSQQGLLTVTLLMEQPWERASSAPLLCAPMTDHAPPFWWGH